MEFDPRMHDIARVVSSSAGADDRDDLYQEIWVKWCERPPRTETAVWLFAHHTAIDFFRRREVRCRRQPRMKRLHEPIIEFDPAVLDDRATLFAVLNRWPKTIAAIFRYNRRRRPKSSRDKVRVHRIRRRMIAALGVEL